MGQIIDFRKHLPDIRRKKRKSSSVLVDGVINSVLLMDLLQKAKKFDT